MNRGDEIFQDIDFSQNEDLRLIQVAICNILNKYR